MKLWIARDKNNALALYTVEPILYYNKYFEGTYKSQMIDLDENLFPEVTFENSPQVVEVKLVKDNNMSILNCNTPVGWVCPKCGRVYAPFVLYCDYCNNKTIIEQNTSK